MTVSTNGVARIIVAAFRVDIPVSNVSEVTENARCICVRHTQAFVRRRARLLAVVNAYRMGMAIAATLNSSGFSIQRNARKVRNVTK